MLTPSPAEGFLSLHQQRGDLNRQPTATTPAGFNDISLDFFEFGRIISLDFFIFRQIICLDNFFFVYLRAK
jgi:hypothetical protein